MLFYAEIFDGLGEGELLGWGDQSAAVVLLVDYCVGGFLLL